MNVEKDDSDLVFDGEALVQENGDNVAHVVSNLLTLGILAHGQVLLHFAKLVHVALVVKKETNDLIS